MDVMDIVRRGGTLDEGPMARRVQRVMLAAIANGEMVAGEALHDREWAAAFETSRTPVREAMQHLHGMGLLDVAAARYTRLSAYKPDAAQREAQDWALLHHAVFATVTDQVTDELIDRLSRLRDLEVGQTDPALVRTRNFTFFHTLRAAAPESAVTLGATSAAYRLRLAEPVLRHSSQAIAMLHNGIIDALTTRNPDHAHHALTGWAISVRPA
jgi:DNA-binding GntR family transcriptional regulator